MTLSKTVFPQVPHLRLRDGSLDWPAIALRNTESAAQVVDIHRLRIYEPGYQAQLQAHAQYLSTQADAAWDAFFKQLPVAPRSIEERSNMGDHFCAYANRMRMLCRSDALSAPATQRLTTHMQHWRERVAAPAERPSGLDTWEAHKPTASRPYSESSSSHDSLAQTWSESDGSQPTGAAPSN